MVSDVDVLLAPDYLSTGIRLLKTKPLSAVLAPCLHLPESCTERLRTFDREGRLELSKIRDMGHKKTDADYSSGMVLTYSYYLHLIRGFDEVYQHYGAEDLDLLKRLEHLGLESVSIGDDTYYLHQWHPRFEGVDPALVEEAIEKNRARFLATRSIRRNPGGWGEGGRLWADPRA
jgi:predicted glycosyltransferase involved in capsule biosynthesis